MIFRTKHMLEKSLQFRKTFILNHHFSIQHNSTKKSQVWTYLVLQILWFHSIFTFFSFLETKIIWTLHCPSDICNHKMIPDVEWWIDVCLTVVFNDSMGQHLIFDVPTKSHTAFSNCIKCQNRKWANKRLEIRQNVKRENSYSNI